MSEAVDERRDRWPSLLRWSDQISCAGLVVLALGWMAASWIYQGGLRGQMIDIDRAGRKPLSFQLDVNQADWPEWTVLPGIGETLAQRIVRARRERGSFRRHEDLLDVPGIGPRTLENIRPYLLPVPAPGTGPNEESLLRKSGGGGRNARAPERR